MSSYTMPRTMSREPRGTSVAPLAGKTLVPADPLHVDAIVQSHERCGAMGISPIRAPDHAPQRSCDWTIASTCSGSAGTRVFPASGATLVPRGSRLMVLGVV